MQRKNIYPSHESPTPDHHSQSYVSCKWWVVKLLMFFSYFFGPDSSKLQLHLSTAGPHIRGHPLPLSWLQATLVLAKAAAFSFLGYLQTSILLIFTRLSSRILYLLDIYTQTTSTEVDWVILVLLIFWREGIPINCLWYQTCSTQTNLTALLRLNSPDGRRLHLKNILSSLTYKVKRMIRFLQILNLLCEFPKTPRQLAVKWTSPTWSWNSSLSRGYMFLRMR